MILDEYYSISSPKIINLCKAWITINKLIFTYLLNLNMNNKLLICNQLAFVCFFRFLFVSLENDTQRVWPINRGYLLHPGIWSFLLYIQGSVYAMHSFLYSYYFLFRDWLRFVIFAFLYITIAVKCCKFWALLAILWATRVLLCFKPT